MWGRRFGSDARYRLNCLVFNPFLNSTDQESMIASALEGKRYFNIKFHPFLPQNSLVADFLNSGNIDLSGLSSAEGWNYGAFNSIALGKQAVVLKAHAHPTYANENNCFFVNPTSMRPVYDGIFFNEHQQFNQGQVHDFNDDEAIAAMELAIKKAHEPNIEGEKLRSEFTFEKTANTILNEIERLK